MKKFLLAIVLGFFAFNTFAQEVSESTLKKVSVGYDLYSSIWLNMPLGVNSRTINQGMNVFAMYNHELNDKGISVAAGLGVSSENLFLPANYVADIHAEVIEFSPITESVTVARNKLNFTYLDIPLELRLKTKNELKFGLGFKFGILLDSKTSYKGEAFDADGNGLGYTVLDKEKKFNQMEKYRFGVQVRAGYKWVQAFGYYSLNKVFIADKGPQMYPIHVGVTFMPF